VSSTGFEPGRTLGRYRLIEQIGAGGMGVVFRARDEKLDRDVAIKLLHPGTLEDESARTRFRAEAAALSKLNHPNIQTILDFGSEPDGDYIAIEYIPGTSLDKMVAGPLDERTAASFGLQLARGLAAAHDVGIVHRDLKPANIRITPDGHLKILDFGLAKVLPRPDDVTAATLSMTKGVVGTVPYMAPEQLRGELVDQRTDIYAAGCVLYEMLTGRRPHPEHGPLLVDAILNQPPSAPSALNRRVSPAFAAIVMRCLEKDPQRRYANARELAAELERFSVTGTAPFVPSQKRRAWVALVAVFGVALLIGMMWLAWHSNAPATNRAAIKALAVLPLENLSPDGSQEYFSAAMTEELTNELAQIGSLRVTSRTSASRYKTKPASLKEVAGELGVDAVIEGSVFRSGEEVRITVQLIDAATDQHLWSRSYERNSKNLITLQREVAQAIAKEIHGRLTPSEAAHFENAPSQNPEAYEAFLRAGYALDGGGQDEQKNDAAITLSERAIALDPNFAAAYVRLAKGCGQKIFFYGAGKEYLERANLALDKALLIDPKSADAYETRGSLFYNKLNKFDIVQALSNYRKAIALNPNLASAYHGLGSELAHLGLHDEAVLAFDESLKLNPFSDGAKFRRARALWQSQRFQEARDYYERMGITIHFELVYVLLRLNRLDDAKALTSRMGTNESGYDVAADEALIYSAANERTKARAAIEKAIQAGSERDHFHHAAFLLAVAYAQLGDPTNAVAMLRKCAETGMPNYALFRNDPGMKSLQGNKEYEAFMAALKPRWDEMVRQVTP
jgi:eukaryotic-like serine/threonine-protein kinase